MERIEVPVITINTTPRETLMQDLASITSIEAYVTAFSGDLADKVTQQSEPLHTPAKGNQHPLLAQLKTKLFDKQADLVTGCVKSLQENRVAALACQMGTGKTPQGIASVHCHANGKAYRALVLCPPHLVTKWKAEVYKFLGNGVKAVIISNWEEFINLRYSPPGDGAEWYIMAMTTAKLGYDKRCAGIPKIVNYIDDQGERQRAHGYVCSRCHYPAYNRKKGIATIEQIEAGWMKCIGMWCKACGKSYTHDYLQCPNCNMELRKCNEPLWQGRSHKVAPVQYVKTKGVRWFQYFIRDECFPGNTLVLMGNHEYKRIDAIVPGDKVLSWDKNNGQVQQTVSRVLIRKRTQRLVEIKFSTGNPLICTEGHKIYVQGEGYVEAKELKEGQRVVRAMQTLPQAVPDYGETASILRQVMLNSPPLDIAELSRSSGGSHEYEVRLATRGRVQADDDVKQRPDYPGEDSEDDCWQAVAWEARREWERLNYLRKDTDGFSELVASHSQDGYTSRRFCWNPNSLQAGFSQPCPDVGHRSGRTFSQFEEGSGSRSTQGEVANQEGVACNPGNEQGCSGTDYECHVVSVHALSSSDEACCDLVYDLEINNTHCYFAGGVLVSNCHESKSADSIDGNACASFSAHAKYTLLLTGTLLAGKSEDIRPLLFRLKPRDFIKLGFGWKDELPFGEQYGRVQTVVRTSEGGGTKRRSGKGSLKSTSKDIKPGIMPQLFPDFVANYTVFMSLPELAINLPSYHEETKMVPMDPMMRAEYDQMKKVCLDAFKSLYQNNRKLAVTLLGPMLEAFMTWPDIPYGRKAVGYYNEEKTYIPVYQPADMDQATIYPKEQALLDVLKQEKALGRKCWVFSVRDDVRDRLQIMLEAHGHKVATLKATVKPCTRLEWLAKHAPTCDVGLSHPQLVETGLELFGPGFNFPTLLWYSTGFRLNTLRQASRRSWRIGQPKDCKTMYLYYGDSAQQTAIGVMASKLVAAEAIEGKFSDGGLADESVDEDIALSVARHMANGIQVAVQSRYKPIEAASTDQDRKVILRNKFAALGEKLRQYRFKKAGK